MVVNIDQSLVQVFGEFAAYAKMIGTFWVIFVGAYWLVRIPKRDRKTLEDYKSQSKTFLLFAGLTLAMTMLITGIYLLHK